MILFDSQIPISFRDSVLGLSQCRLVEHTQFRQINPFEAITDTSSLRPQNYIDIIDVSSPVTTLTGLTLSDLMEGRYQSLPLPHINQLFDHIEDSPVQQMLKSVKANLLEYNNRQIVRNLPAHFLPKDNNNPLGVQGLQSALFSWVTTHKNEKLSPEQWLSRIKKLSNNGLRKDELKISSLEENIHSNANKSISGNEVLNCLTYRALQLSILPVVSKAGSHLIFSKIPANTIIKRIKPKIKSGLVSHPQYRERVLGYWIDVIDWNDLLGYQHGWMAFTNRGQPITSKDKPFGLCHTKTEAMELADNHAGQFFPNMTARGQWSQYRLTGGEQYREWLVTLPYYRPSYFSDHFYLRNVLLHVRCDIREGANGERVLYLHEVQSDWAQQARRTSKANNDSSQKIPVPPWLQEWPTLALKLMLLHAVRLNVSALAWTPGSIQVKRYKGLGEKGLLELYDHTLPNTMTRILRPNGEKCKVIDVYLPVNFYIEPADIGYIIMDQDHNFIDSAATWSEAKAQLPDGAHELLTPMHGINISEALRENILKNGFYAWGEGIQ
jgi:hypothetical protein